VIAGVLSSRHECGPRPSNSGASTVPGRAQLCRKSAADGANERKPAAASRVYSEAAGKRGTENRLFGSRGTHAAHLLIALRLECSTVRQMRTVP
jgi:hypothetical protein